MNVRRRYKTPETPPHRFAIGQQSECRSGGGATMKTSALLRF